MPPRQNAKAIAGNARKLEAEAVKTAKLQAAKELRDEEKWKTGSKDESKKQQLELKRQEGTEIFLICSIDQES